MKKRINKYYDVNGKKNKLIACPGCGETVYSSDCFALCSRCYRNQKVFRSKYSMMFYWYYPTYNNDW